MYTSLWLHMYSYSAVSMYSHLKKMYSACVRNFVSTHMGKNLNVIFCVYREKNLNVMVYFT